MTKKEKKIINKALNLLWFEGFSVGVAVGVILMIIRGLLKY